MITCLITVHMNKTMAEKKRRGKLAKNIHIQNSRLCANQANQHGTNEREREMD